MSILALRVKIYACAILLWVGREVVLSLMYDSQWALIAAQQPVARQLTLA